MQAAKFDHGEETVLLSEDILRSVAWNIVEKTGRTH